MIPAILGFRNLVPSNETTKDLAERGTRHHREAYVITHAYIPATHVTISRPTTDLSELWIRQTVTCIRSMQLRARTH